MATEKETPVQEEKAATLQNFSWDDPGDFFGIENSAIEKDEVGEILEVVKIEKDDEEDGDEGKPSGKNDISFFGDEEDVEDKGEETSLNLESTRKPAKENIYEDLYAEMKEGGIFQADLEEGAVLDREKFIELQDLEIEARVDEALEGFMKELDEDGAAFIKFKKNGGVTADFFKTYGTTTEIPTGDLDDEAHQERVSRYYYKNIEGLDSEDVDDRIEWLKTSGKLEKYAIKIDTDLKEREEQAKENLQIQSKAEAKAAEVKRKEFIDSVQETLDNTDEIDNFKFTPSEKKSLHSFITKPSIKIGKNLYVTPFQQKLRTALADKGKMLILAKLLSNDFDVSDVVAAKTTEQTKKAKNDLQRQKTVAPVSSGKAETRERGLADFF